ncbi:MAG TPA: hypothetical protein VHW60_22250 [Caulobacteraceae bacterium]|jgi:hypothetical protein|nr:hypothetical protein [Caulobacteraceae bacterium]
MSAPRTTWIIECTPKENGEPVTVRAEGDALEVREGGALVIRRFIDERKSVVSAIFADGCWTSAEVSTGGYTVKPETARR